MPTHVMVCQLSVDIIVERDGTEYHAYCPAFKGLHTCGRIKKEAIANAKNAIVAYVVSLLKNNEPIPCCKVIDEDMIDDLIPVKKNNIVHENVAISVPR